MAIPMLVFIVPKYVPEIEMQMIFGSMAVSLLRNNCYVTGARPHILKFINDH
jgi:hypothetical protein